MSIKHIEDLIIKQRQSFFNSYLNNDDLLSPQIKKSSNYCGLYEALFIIGPFSIIVPLLTLFVGMSSFSLLSNLILSIFLSILFVTFSTYGFLYFYFKIIQKKIKDKIINNESYRNEFFDYFLTPIFESSIIDDEMLQQVKLSLTLDQFKVLRATNTKGVTYKNLSDFINNIENINTSLIEAEEDKYTLNYSDIKQYIKTT